MATSLRVAIADDELDMRDYLSRALIRSGYEIAAVACNGRELVELCRQQRPDIVLTDIRMPQLDGVAAAQEIWRMSDVPVIFITAFQQDIFSDDTRGHIVVSLQKPVKLPGLRTALETAHAKQRLLGALRKLLPDSQPSDQIVVRLEQELESIRKSSQLDALEAALTCERELMNPASPLCAPSYWTDFPAG